MKQIVKWFACFSLFALPAYAATILSTDFTDFANSGNSYTSGARTNTTTSAAWPYADAIFKPAEPAAANGIGSKGLVQLKASDGTLTLPPLAHPVSLTLTAHVGSKAGNMLLQRQNGSSWTTLASFPVTPDGSVFTHTFTNAGSAAVLRFSAAANVTYLRDLVVTDSTSDTAPVWSSIPAQYVLADDNFEANLFDYVTGATTVSLTASSTEEYYFDDANGDFLFSSSDMGTYSFTFRADNEAGFSFATLSVNVTDSIPSATAPSINAIANRTMDIDDILVEFTVSATGTPAPTFSVTSSDAPAGSFDIDSASGEFSFMPESTGTFHFTVTAANTAGADSKTFAVTVTDSTPTGTAPSINAIADRTMDIEDILVEFTVSATGTPTPTFSVTSSDAPAGSFTIAPSSGEFSFMPEAAGTFHFTVTADNGVSPAATVSFTVTVTPASVPAPTLTISNETDTTADASWTAVSGASAYTLQLASDEHFTPGSGFSEDFSAFASASSYSTNSQTVASGTWSYDGVILSPGGAANGEGSKGVAQLRASNGTLCLPSIDNPSTLTVVARASAGTLALQQQVAGTWTTIGSFAMTSEGTACTHTFTNAGAAAALRFVAGTRATYIHDVSVVSSDGSLLGEITTTATSHTFTGLVPNEIYCARVKADDGDWSAIEMFETEPASGTAPSITAIADQTYVYGANEGIFSLNVTASGTPAPTFSVASADAPEGYFEINPTSGVFSFMPLETGTFHFTVTAANGVSPDATASFAVAVTGTVPAVTPIADKTITLEDGGIEFQIVATGNPPPSFGATSTTAPAGTYDIDANGVFIFTPKAEGTFFFIVTASNSLGSSSISFAVTVTPSVQPVPELTVANVSATSADASWTAITGALSYTLQLGTDYDFAPASGYAEDFSSFASDPSYATNSQTVSSGTWSYETVKMTPGGATNGVGTKGYAQLQATHGHLYLPSIDNPAKLTVVARATGGILTLQQQVGGTWTTIDSFTLEPTGTAHTHTFANAGTAVALRLVAGANATYVYDVSVVSDDGTLVEEVTIPGWSHTFTDLSPSTLYCARVKADNSDWSDVELFETAAPAGTAPTLSAVGDQTISLEDGGLEFTVTATGTPAPTFSVTSSDAPAGTFTIGENDGVFLFTAESEGTFHFTVTAANGVSPDATVSFAVTVVSSVLPAPLLTIANVTETTADASWTAITGASAYTLQLGSDGNFTPGPGYAEDFTSFPSASSYSTNSRTVDSGTWTYDGAKFTPGGAANGEGSKGNTTLRAGGTLDLPAIDHPSKVTVAARVSSGTGTLTLQQYASGSWSDVASWTLSTTGTVFSHTLSGTGTSVALRLTGAKVTTIHDVAVASADGSLLEEISLSGVGYTFGNLDPGTHYYARVNADDGEWSSVVDFTTEQASGFAPVWSAIPVQTIAAGADCDLDLASYVSGTDPIAITMADTEYDAVLVGTEFSFTPDTLGSFTFTFTAANDFGSADATLTVTAVGNAPVVTVTPATYAYNVTVGDPYVEFSVAASGNPAPVLSDSCTESAYYVFENGNFLFDPDTAGTYHFVFTATSSAGSDSKTVTVTVSSPVVSRPTLTITNETATTADAFWTAVAGVSSYTLQLASDEHFTTGGTGQTLTLFDNAATTPSSAPIGWTYNIKNDSGAYLQLTTADHYVLSDTFDTSACVNMTLSLKARTYNGTAEGTTNLLVQYTTDNGATWHDIGTVSASTATLTAKELDASAAIGHSSVRFRFSVPGAVEGKGLGISTLLLTGKETSATGSLIGEYTVNGTEYTFTGLAPDTIYYARVKGGDGEWSDIVDFLTDSGGSPSADSAELVITDPYSGQFQVVNFSSDRYYQLLYTTDLRKPLQEYETLNLGWGPASGEFCHDFPVDGDWFGGLRVLTTAP